MKKIHIIGGPGSGKSYMAHRLAEILSCEHTDLDKLYWKDSTFSQRLDAAERTRCLTKITNGTSWVIEGAYCAEWLEPSFENADQIIILAPPVWLQRLRLVRRIAWRMVKRDTNLMDSLRLLRWVNGFETLFRETFSPHYASKTIYLTRKRDIIDFLKLL